MWIVTKFSFVQICQDLTNLLRLLLIPHRMALSIRCFISVQSKFSEVGLLGHREHACVISGSSEVALWESSSSFLESF